MDYLGPCRPGKEFDFCSTREGKSLENLRQRSDKSALLSMSDEE